MGRSRMVRHKAKEILRSGRRYSSYDGESSTCVVAGLQKATGKGTGKIATRKRKQLGVGIMVLVVVI